MNDGEPRRGMCSSPLFAYMFMIWWLVAALSYINEVWNAKYECAEKLLCREN